jgi:hypothetical protein
VHPRVEGDQKTLWQSEEERRRVEQEQQVHLLVEQGSTLHHPSGAKARSLAL